MPFFSPRAHLVRASALLGLAAYLAAYSPPSRAAGASGSPAETRALWVLRTSLTSPASIATLVRSARDHGFNTLLVQVRGRGDSYFTAGVEPRASELLRQPATFDPLQTTLDEAHAVGLRVHAWVNINLVSSAVNLPSAANHIVRRHPEWLMVPRDIAAELAGLSPSAPAYVNRLARWSRGQTDDVEGLYASPVIPAAAAHIHAVVRDLVKRYPVDGVHFDYARYPSERFDYSRTALHEFRASVRPRLDAAIRRDLDRREKANPFTYPDNLPDDWKSFRVARMTGLMTRLRDAVKAVRPGALVTVATAPDLREAYNHRLQDWGVWLTTGVVDAVCPMAYTPEPARFAAQIAAARALGSTGSVWAGIGAYRISPAQTIENIQTARRLGATGVVLFSYDSLVDKRVSSPDALATIGRGAFAPPATSAGSR